VPVPRPTNQSTPADLGLAYSTVNIPTTDGGTLEAWAVPAPTPRGIVLLFPAYASSKDSLLQPVAALHGLGYSAFLVDYRGVGGSSGNTTTLGVREAVDVAQATAYVQRTWPGQPITLYGVSLGSAAVMRAVAQEGVQPAAVILESPFDRLLTGTGHRLTAAGLPAFPLAGLLVFWGSVQQGFNGFAHNPVEYAPAIRCPALVLHGSADPRVTTAEAQAVFAALPGPKQYVEVPGATHELLIGVAPALWQGTVGQFLAQLPAAPPTQP